MISQHIRKWKKKWKNIVHEEVQNVSKEDFESKFHNDYLVPTFLAIGMCT